MYLKLNKILDKLMTDYSIEFLLELSDGNEYTYSIETESQDQKNMARIHIETLLDFKKNGTSLRCLADKETKTIHSVIKNQDYKEIMSETLDNFCLKSYFNPYLKNINNRKRAVELGYKTIDEAIGGLWMGKTYLIGAPSGHAKTIMLINLCKRISLDLKVKSCYIDLELGRDRLMDRISSMVSRMNVNKFAGDMSQHKKDNLVKSLNEVPLENINLCDFSKRRVDFKEVEEHIRYYYSKGVTVFFIDYVQNIVGNKSLDKKEELSDMSYSLRLLANELNITFFMATQLNRGSSVCDIFEFNQDRVSDSIELVRDRDFMINLRKYLSDNPDHTGILECFIAKNREGEQKKFYLKFEEGWTGNLSECEEPTKLSEEESKSIKIPEAPVSSFYNEVDANSLENKFLE